jgi:hypothetical protein
MGRGGGGEEEDLFEPIHPTFVLLLFSSFV